MLRIATVFSGIGAPEQALHKLKINHQIVFACDNGERELDMPKNEIEEATCAMNNRDRNAYVKELYKSTHKTNFVKQSYFTNYNINEDQWYEDIRFIDGNEYRGKVDVLVGGSPCQSFSIIGKRAGLEDARGTLFYDFARLINEIEPQAFIYENVVGMLVHDNGNTWKHIKEIFNSIGYNINISVLNAMDYGIPQDRKRLFVVGFRNQNVKFQFPNPVDLTTTLFDYLEPSPVAARHYLGKKGFEFVTNPKYKNRARVNKPIIQTQKANQQFNWNGDFIFEDLDVVKDNPEVMARAYVGQWHERTGVIRQMTYRECLRLMGFSDDFKVVVPNVHAYRQIGNSIVVNVLESIFTKIIDSINSD